MGNASSDSGGGNDSSSSCGGGISSEAIDRCVNTITLDNGGSINCRTGEISSHSLNDAIGHTPSNSGLDRNDEDRPTYSSASSYDRQFVNDCYRSERDAYDKLLHTIDLGHGNSYNNRTGEYSYNSLSGVIGNNAVVVGVSVEQQKTQLLRKIKEHRADPMIKAIVTFNLNRRIESIKPDTDTKRYVDNIDKYREFAVIYNGAEKDYRDGKITWGECIQIKYAAKVEYDKDYWSALDNITRNQFELWDAYDKGFININKYNEYSNRINEKCTYILTTNNVTVHQKPPAPVTITPTAPQPRVENGHVMSAQARVNAVNQVASVVSTTARAVANGATAVGNAYIQGSNDMANTRRMEAQATQQLVSNVATTVVNNAPQVIRETAQGVSSVGFEVATQVATGLHTTNLMISGANEALSSINNREKGVVETTGEALATGVATYVGGQVGSVISTGLLVKTAIETNMNVVGNIIQEEINRHQQGGV